MLAKEKSRVERNNHAISVISLKVGSLDQSAKKTKHFLALLKKKIRITDDIGWLDYSTIGILLFNTSKAGAIKFLKRIHQLYPSDQLWQYAITTYSSHGEDQYGEEKTDTLSDDPFHGFPSLTGIKPEAASLHPIFLHKISNSKRFSDIVLSSLALLVLSPLLLLIAIAVKTTTKGPILFRQRRAGIGGRPFTLLKFRTMVADADKRKSELVQFNERTGPVFKMKDDPRITKVGKFLRRWSLDELPQFVNVLVGEMSLVGPRPPTMDEVEQYERWHKNRLEVKPGITCIWQVYSRHEKSFENWVRLDINYMKRQTFVLDMKLLLMTIPAVLSRKGAC